MSAHQFPLVAEAERADGAQGWRTERRGAVQDARVAEARLPVPALLPEQQHVGQVGDVAGGQAQRLYLGELPVGGLGGNERAERREGRVHAVRPVPLPRVGRLPLFAHTGVSTAAASAPSPPSPGVPSGLLPGLLPRLSVRAAAVGAVAAAVQILQILQVGGEAVGLRAALGALGASGLHPGSARVRLELLGPCAACGRLLHITLS